MISRPKNTDTMDDVIKMQEDYIKQSKTEKNFEPAAKITNQRESKNNTDTTRKSIFAQQRNLHKSKESSSKQIEEEIISDVVERKYDKTINTESNMNYEMEEQGFPAALKIKEFSNQVDDQKKSIFSRTMKTGLKSNFASSRDTESMEVTSDVQKSIHDENMQLLNKLSVEEILEEKKKLLESMNPKLIEFLNKKKKLNTPEKVEKIPKTSNESREALPQNDLPSLDFLKDESSTNWLNMDIFEPEKLEWTRNIEEVSKSLKPGEKFEARFDWKGFLLPYVFDNEAPVNYERELFLHGTESHRPGYTLQELFRLARANVLQQRVSAINAISGILNVYNQGYYDGILDLPIAKIFFFLRFALDENISAIIDSSMRALANLFYNNIDEALLDTIFETNSGYIQPILNNNKFANRNVAFSEDTNDVSENLPFELNMDELIDDQGNAGKNINDFHLAEVDLTECLIRTNIVERIHYIISTLKPNQSTVQSCLKILIRIARSKCQHARDILIKNKKLIECLTSKYLPKIDENVKESDFLILKLFRILASYDYSHFQTFEILGAVKKVMIYICTQSDININFIKLQIESLRFLRLYFGGKFNESLYNELLFPLKNLLSWHYNNLDFQRDNHYIVRTHASAVLYLIGISNISVAFELFGDALKMCSCKWFYMARQNGVKEFSQTILLSSVLNIATCFVKLSSEFFYDFIDDYLLKFIQSNHYKSMEKILMNTSPLLSKAKDRSNAHKPLSNIGSIIQLGTKSSPTLIIPQDYPVFFIDALLRFVNGLNNANNTRNIYYYNQLISIFNSVEIKEYLQSISSRSQKQLLSTNWFVKQEINMILEIIKSQTLKNDIWIFKVAMSLINLLTRENFSSVLFVLDNFIFNQLFYSNDILESELSRWKYIYNGVLLSKVQNTQYDNFYAAVEGWKQVLLDESWTFSLLLILLYNVEISTEEKRIVETDLKEDEIITTTLKFNNQLRKIGAQTISKDQQFMYLMLVYFGNDLNFLDENIKQMIKEELETFQNATLNFNMKLLNHEKSFENLYTMFLDTFQANGYGDEIFSALIMAPLAQKYDSKWRKMVWSEYAMVLKFIKCRESDLLLDEKEYFWPIETDESLLKSYSAARKLNYLTENTLPWKIANHHLSTNN